VTIAELLSRASAAADVKAWDTAADILADAQPTDEVLDRRGWYCSRAKRYDEAITAFEQLRARRPRDYLPPYMIGYQYYQQQQWAAAVSYFDEALGHRPEHIKSLWRRAYALHRLGRETQAVVTAGRLLRAWHALPDDKRDEDRRRYAQACHLIGRYQASHDPNGAVELLRQAAEHGPTDAYHHYQLAKALRRAGHPVEAITAAEQARRLKRNDASIELEYTAALAATGRLTEAAACLRRVQRSCSGWLAYRAGTLSLEVGDRGLAVDLLRRAARDPATRREPRVQQAIATALGAAEGAAPNAGPPLEEAVARSAAGPRHRQRGRQRLGSAASASSSTDADGTGTVDVIRDDRNFGFLKDDHGVRRHFRLPQAHMLHKGDRVVFTPTSATKGPAARDVRRA